MKRYHVKLTKAEVDELRSIIRKGSHSAFAFRAAYIIINCDEGEYSNKVTNEQISQVLKIGMRTIDRVKQRFSEEGLGSVLERRTTSREYDLKVDADLEAKLVKLCCGEPPEGYVKWSLRLLANKMIELNYIKNISHVTVSNVLKKRNLTLMA